jgi:hypothetical protein
MEIRNKRQEIKAGKLRDVWDEYEGEVRIRTAVWDVTNRQGEKIDQSWDEQEAEYEAIKQKRDVGIRYEKHRTSDEHRKEKRERMEKRRYIIQYAKRDSLAEAINAWLDDGGGEQPIPQMPSYKFFKILYPYIISTNCSAKSVSGMVVIMKAKRQFFEDMGFTFSEGLSSASRMQCMYIGYKTTEKRAEERKKDARDREIQKMLELIPEGAYTHPQMRHALIAVADEAGYKGTLGPGLVWVLVRNTHKFNITWEDNIFEVKHGI